MPQLTERRNTKIMLIESQWKAHLSLQNEKYGFGLITSRLDETTRSSIELSVIFVYKLIEYALLREEVRRDKR